MPANGKSTNRFELPSIKPVNYSLTDGTDIPPPPDSPIEEQAPPTAPPKLEPAPEQPTTSANGVYDGRGRTDAAPPLSPTSSKRPSSIRRFLSRKSLHSSYTNGTNKSHEDVAGIERPESSLSFASGRPSVSSKRSGSWFRRLGGGSRTSVVYENGAPEEKVQPMGPPPPKLPELNQLKAKVADDDQGSLGAEDMFKNIK